MRKSLFFCILIFSLIACSAGARATGKGLENSAGIQAVSGVWELVKDDDDLPEETSQYEVLHLGMDGGLRIAGSDFLYCGHWELSGNQIIMTANRKGRESTFRRVYEVDGRNLRLKNRKRGFVHYAKLDEPIRPCKPYETWEAVTGDGFTAMIPNNWEARTRRKGDFRDSGNELVGIEINNASNQKMIRTHLKKTVEELWSIQAGPWPENFPHDIRI